MIGIAGFAAAARAAQAGLAQFDGFGCRPQ